jgi:hypothetical protein
MQHPPTPLIHQLTNSYPLNRTLLLPIPTNLPILIRKIRRMHLPQKLLVMSNDDNLEIRLAAASSDELIQRAGKSFDVVGVEIGGGFVKGDDLMISLVLRR